MPKLLAVGGYGFPKAANIAKTFFDVAGIVEPIQKLAIEQLIYNLSNFGLWDKIIALYPMVGGTALSHSFNLKNCIDNNLTFLGGWTHSETGAKPNGINAYAETNLSRSSPFFNFDGKPDNVHISYFLGTASGAGECVLGAYDGGFAPIWMLPDNGGNGNFANGSFDNFLLPLQSPNLALSSMIFGYTTMGFAMNNGVVTDMFRALGFGINNLTYLVGANNSGSGTQSRYTSARCQLASIGVGFTKDEALALHRITNDFQATLNR